MLKMKFDINSGALIKILCLGAHCDDLEIGCGGTILKILNTLSNTEVDWIVFSGKGKRAGEAKNSAISFLIDAKKTNIEIKGFKDGFFPYTGAEIKNHFEELKRRISPDLIFTHYRNDLHQDHRLISELTWNTFRDHLIFEYEIVKYDGDIGSPNLFFHLDEHVCRKKIDLILNTFKSQKTRNWFTEDSFLSIMRLRGLESNSNSRFAEGFYCRKVIA